MKRNVVRKAAILVGASAAGVVALAVQYVSRPTPLPWRGPYFLSELAYAQVGTISIVIAVASAYAFGFYLQAPPVLVGLSMLAVFSVVAVREMALHPTSHNLLGFEMLFWAAGAFPLAMAAWLGRSLARGSKRRNIWSGTEGALRQTKGEGDG